MALRPWNILSFCAGVGGLELGIRIAEPGARGIAYVEREAAAAASLVASMEAGWFHPAPVWSDAGTFDARPWRGLVHCIASGDPCQPNSVAGKRQGADDERWLIDQLLRLVDECRPRRLFRENVPGNLDGQLAALVPALEGMGYRCAAGIFSAAEVGASHRRERFFLMADQVADSFSNGCERGAQPHLRPIEPGQQASRRGDAERCDRALGDAVQSRSFPAPCPGIYRGEEGSRPRHAEFNRRGGSMADASDRELQVRSGHDGIQGEREALGRRSEQPARLGASGEDCDRRCAGGDGRAGSAGCDEGTARDLPPFAPSPSDPRWPDILAGAPELEPAVRRMADGLAYRIERLRAAGNGVCPLAAAHAWASLDATLAAARVSAAAAVRSAA